MALTTVEVTAVSRNSGTRRIREDTQGHEQGANQVQEDTQGTAGIRKDAPLCRFGLRARLMGAAAKPATKPGRPLSSHASVRRVPLPVDSSVKRISRGGVGARNRMTRLRSCWNSATLNIRVSDLRTSL